MTTEKYDKYRALLQAAKEFDAPAFEKELAAVGEVDDEAINDVICFMNDSFYDNVLKQSKPRIPEETALEAIRKVLSLMPFDEKGFGNGLRYCAIWGEGGKMVPLLMEYPIPVEYLDKAIGDAKFNNNETTLKTLEMYKEGVEA